MKALWNAYLTSSLILMTSGAVCRADKVVLVAGGGSGGDASLAKEAKLQSPFGVVFDRAGNLYLVEMTGERVRKIDTLGVIATIAGNGKKGDAGDNRPGSMAQFNGMHSLEITRAD